MFTSVVCVFFRELVEAKETMRAQHLEEMLSSVQVTLDEQFSTSQTVRNNIMAQLQNFHTQVSITCLMKVFL